VNRHVRAALKNCHHPFLALGLVFLMLGCRKDASVRPYSLFDATKPILSIGADLENREVKAYKTIMHYTVDRIGNVFVGDYSEVTIDKYDAGGKYLFSFGRKGQGPGEFDGNVPAFAVNSRGETYTYSLRHKFIVFNPDGSLKEEVPFPSEAKSAYAESIKIDPHDYVHVMFSGPDNKVFLSRFSPDLKSQIIYHWVETRAVTGLGVLRFLPDLDFDQKGNAYVTDNHEYRIYVYDPDAKISRKIERPAKKEKIIPKDLIFFGALGRGIVDFSKDPNALAMLRGLSVRDSCLPAIFGINAWEDGFLVWTTERDAEYRYIIDVFDADMKPIGRTAGYNIIGSNMAVVRKNRIYLPDLGSHDLAFKKKIGRLSAFNDPSSLHMYELKKKTK
jgi:hypothetical protein